MNTQDIILIFLVIIGVIIVILLLKEVFTMIFNAVNSLQDQVKSALNSGMDVMKNISSSAVDGMKSVINLTSKTIDKVKDGMKEMMVISGEAFKEITQVTFGVIGSMSNIGADITREISGAVTTSVDITKNFGKSVINTVGKFDVNIEQITRHMEDVGLSLKNNVERVADNLGGVKDIVNKASEIGDGILKPVVDLASANVKLGADVFKKVSGVSSDVITTMVKPIGDSINNILKVATQFSTMLDGMVS